MYLFFLFFGGALSSLAATLTSFLFFSPTGRQMSTGAAVDMMMMILLESDYDRRRRRRQKLKIDSAIVRAVEMMALVWASPRISFPMGKYEHLNTNNWHISTQMMPERGQIKRVIAPVPYPNSLDFESQSQKERAAT